MKNIQIIDGALNATFSIFQATEDEFAIIFLDGRDMEIAEDLVERVGEDEANRVLGALWERPILKREVAGYSRNAVLRRGRTARVPATFDARNGLG